MRTARDLALAALNDWFHEQVVRAATVYSAAGFDETIDHAPALERFKKGYLLLARMRDDLAQAIINADAARCQGVEHVRPQASAP